MRSISLHRNHLWVAMGLLFLSVGSLRSETSEAGAAGSFLDFGVGGRPIGMGRAFTGVSDDVDALYWNPGGLATFRASQVTLQQSDLTEDVAYQYFGVVQPIYTYGAIAAGVMNLDTGKVDRTDENFIKTGTFDSRETAYQLSYAHRLGDQWGVGATMKLVENEIDNKKASGTGADIGAMYMPTEVLRIGAMVRNMITPKYKFDTDTEDFSRLARMGASYQFLNGRLMVASDYEKVVGGPERNDKWFLGVEGKAFENIALRAGVNTDGLAAGAGIGWKSFVLDYAGEYQEIGFFHRFSLKVFFGGFEVDVAANPTVFSPVGVKRTTNISILCRNRNRIVKWLLTIKSSKGVIVRSFQGYNTPPESVEWDGKDSRDRVVEPGVYYYALVATDNKNNRERTRVRQIRIVSPTPIELEAK